MKNKVNKGWISIVIITVLLIILSVIFTGAIIVNFIGLPASKNMTDWGELGSYASFIVSILNLSCFIILTYKALDFEQKSYEKQSEFQIDTFNKQMMVQKIELLTSFRKTHIEEIHKEVEKLHKLPYYEIRNDEKEFEKFKIGCESVINTFRIFENNKNVALIGVCSYSEVNKELNKLDEVVRKLDFTKGITKEQSNNLWEILDKVNAKIIQLEKDLKSHTIMELDKIATEIHNKI